MEAAEAVAAFPGPHAPPGVPPGVGWVPEMGSVGPDGLAMYPLAPLAGYGPPGMAPGPPLDPAAMAYLSQLPYPPMPLMNMAMPVPVDYAMAPYGAAQEFGPRMGDMPPPMAPGSPMDYVLGQFPCVRMRGIPYEATLQDVMDFFQAFKPFIVDVVLPVTVDGRATGDACVLFSGLFQAQAALARDRQLMGRRYIEIFPASRDVYYKTVRKMVLAAAGGDAAEAGAGGGSGTSKKGMRRSRQGATKEEVAAVLAELLASEDIETVLVDTLPGVEAMLKHLAGAEELALAWEGRNLSRYGTLSLLQLFRRPAAGERARVFLVDVVGLGSAGFQHALPDAGSQPASLGALLESPAVKKLVFDPRTGGDALFHLHQVALAEVVCLQVAELALRQQRGGKVRLVAPLNRVIEDHAQLEAPAARQFAVLKAAGKQLVAGADASVWDGRPLKAELEGCATMDVCHLFAVYDNVWDQLAPELREKVLAESGKRALFYQGPDYDPSDRTLAEATAL